MFQDYLYTKIKKQPKIELSDKTILDFLLDYVGHTKAEIAKHIGRSARSTCSPLVELIERGMVREIGSGSQDPQQKYCLAECSDRSYGLPKYKSLTIIPQNLFVEY